MKKRHAYLHQNILCAIAAKALFLFCLLVALFFNSTVFAVDEKNALGALQVKTVFGRAYKTKDKRELVYKEIHERTFSGTRLVRSLTKYTNSAGQVFATLACDYSRDITVPDYIFKDERTGYEERAYFKNGKIVSEVRETKAAEVQRYIFDEKILSGDKIVSMSQGLNELITQRITTLKKEESLETTFLLPARQTEATMRVSGELDKARPGVINISIRISPWILRLFVDSIRIAYSYEDKRLLSYDGYSNLKTDAGESQHVFIVYDYDGSKANASEAEIKKRN